MYLGSFKICQVFLADIWAQGSKNVRVVVDFVAWCRCWRRRRRRWVNSSAQQVCFVRGWEWGGVDVGVSNLAEPLKKYVVKI